MGVASTNIEKSWASSLILTEIKIWKTGRYSKSGCLRNRNEMYHDYVRPVPSVVRMRFARNDKRNPGK